MLKIILLTSGYCNVSESPQNLAVYVGQRTSFACQPTRGSFVREWLFRPLSDSTNTKIFTNWVSEKSAKKTDSKYGVVANERGFTELFLNETEMEDAGEYTCVTEVDAKIVSYRADLVVLESEPECSVTEFVDHRIRVGCSVTYSGKWPPKMEWRHHITGTAFADGTLFYNGINIDDYANKTHVSSTLNAFVLHSVQEAFTVSCKTFFDTWQAAFSKFSASNVPDFVYIWNSTVFGAKKSTHEPADEADEGFENITCPSHADVSTQATKQEPQNECMMSMYILAALEFALILMLTGALAYVFYKKKTNAAVSIERIPLVDEEISTSEGNLACINESIALEIEEEMRTKTTLSSRRTKNTRKDGTQAQFSGCTHWL